MNRRDQTKYKFNILNKESNTEDGPSMIYIYSIFYIINNKSLMFNISLNNIIFLFFNIVSRD